jgi:catechol-2,3-dioxygenase
MNIEKLELLTSDLHAQSEFYSQLLELPVERTSFGLHIQAGTTELVFTQAPSDFDGVYHFAFNIPENQYFAAKKWISSRAPLLRDKTGKEDFNSQSWNSDSVYFLDAAGNVLEFIARHNLANAATSDFDRTQILNVSEIGLPSENVIRLAKELCAQLGIFVFKQEPNETFTPVGDDNGLLILPVANRIWMPDSGVPAKMLPLTVTGNSDGKRWEVRGVPYRITYPNQP